MVHGIAETGVPQPLQHLLGPLPCPYLCWEPEGHRAGVACLAPSPSLQRAPGLLQGWPSQPSVGPQVTVLSQSLSAALLLPSLHPRRRCLRLAVSFPWPFSLTNGVRLLTSTQEGEAGQLAALALWLQAEPRQASRGSGSVGSPCGPPGTQERLPALGRGSSAAVTPEMARASPHVGS